MSRKILDSRAREIVIKVDQYFYKEKKDTSLLLHNVARSLKNTPDTSKTVNISKETVIEILKHLRNLTKVTERVCSATGITKNTVTKIRRENEVATATGTKIKAPMKKKRGKIEFLDRLAMSTLRNIINSMYTAGKDIPTMREILAAAKQDLDYKGSKATLRRLLKRKLGYRFKKCYQNKFILIERPKIQVLRSKYLRRMKDNDSLGANKKTVIYIDENWIHTNVGVKKNDRPGTGHGSYWIIVHAGCESGFVDKAFYMFKSDIKTDIYHNQMKFENFTKWLEENLIPNIPHNCIIVMDNTSYHSKKEDIPPNMSSKIGVMVEWLQANNIEFPKQYTKSELYTIIKNNIMKKNNIIDNLLANHSHEVVRLPPYNCDLNPMKYIWNIVKQRVSDNNVEQSESRIASLILEALQSITPEYWKKKIEHVKRLGDEYWHKDRLLDEMYNINTENDSESETTDLENSSESDLHDLNYMSGVEECDYI